MSDLSGELTVTLSTICCEGQGETVSNKGAAKEFYMEKFNLKALNEVGEREKYQLKISNGFPACKNLESGT